MTQTIGTYVIDVVPESFRELRTFFGFKWDRWGSSGYERAHQSYGWVGGWEFTCKEDANAVAWTGSTAYLLLYPYLTSGVAVDMTISIDTRHATPASQQVYVESVEVWYEDALNTRYIAVTVSAV